MASSFFYIYVMATSFFYIDIDIDKLTERPVVLLNAIFIIVILIAGEGWLPKALNDWYWTTFGWFSTTTYWIEKPEK